MKRITAILLVALSILALASCSLIRKATDPADVPRAAEGGDDAEAGEPAVKEYTVAEAIEIVKNSSSADAAVAATGKIVAENDGTEFYVIEITEGDRKSLRYVSKAGEVRGALADGNVDTSYAENAFKNKYGEENAKTGGKYKLVYEGLLKSGETYCYNFAVYEVADGNETYSFNFLVTVDGKMSAETKIDH